MKVNELMIGNYLYFCGWNAKVTGVREDGVYVVNDLNTLFKVDITDVRPISLTKEFFERNGFKKEYEELCYSKEIDGYYIDITFGLSNRSEDHVACHVDNNDRQTVGCADILYIHQLQNLLNVLNIKADFII